MLWTPSSFSVDLLLGQLKLEQDAMSKLKQLTPAEKLSLAIQYVARGVPLPKDLADFLERHNLTNAVRLPR